VSLSGVHVDCIDRSGAVAQIERFVADGGRHQVVTVNTDFVRLAEIRPGYRELLNDAALAVADGMPLVWLSRLAGKALPERVAGIDLVDDCCRIASRAGVPVFLLGAAPGVAAAAGRTLAARHAGLRVAGTFAPPFAPPSPEGDAEMVRLVQAVGRCVLFVAFGAPRQDEFINAHLPEMDAAVAMGVGGTLDILAGNIRRAPAWMQRRGLEWVWRLAQEPRRLWRRYLLEDIPFLARFAMRIVRGNAPALDTR
jgi:N-acetylglucosaminyldiphosphoundecaprenol N-acetyl-beta-D-mannosaminyltransferase